MRSPLLVRLNSGGSAMTNDAYKMTVADRYSSSSALLVLVWPLLLLLAAAARVRPCSRACTG